ncbi:MAG: F0F1 ATP synthase subunit B', partial [Rhodospirillaceae bacterium]|nr:F0F1 ATP synthase subunit B' [Rhodospirillaceae bacterium]
RQTQLTKRLSASIKDAEAGIATAKAEALSSIKEVAVDVARSAISKLTGEDANEASVSKAVSSALKDRA